MDSSKRYLKETTNLCVLFHFSEKLKGDSEVLELGGNVG